MISMVFKFIRKVNVWSRYEIQLYDDVYTWISAISLRSADDTRLCVLGIDVSNEHHPIFAVLMWYVVLGLLTTYSSLNISVGG